ncbi:MAG: hypothetical protein NTY46_10185 [Candidatus Sumerlaeota bacterium]|nr:hypothetical protein [Candidatus Sumerlaeota bacterium]
MIKGVDDDKSVFPQRNQIKFVIIIEGLPSGICATRRMRRATALIPLAYRFIMGDNQGLQKVISA